MIKKGDSGGWRQGELELVDNTSTEAVMGHIKNIVVEEILVEAVSHGEAGVSGWHGGQAIP